MVWFVRWLNTGIMGYCDTQGCTQEQDEVEKHECTFPAAQHVECAVKLNLILNPELLRI